MSKDLNQETTYVDNHYHCPDSGTVAERTQVRLSWGFDSKPSDKELVFLSFRGGMECELKLNKDSAINLGVWMLKHLQGSALTVDQRVEVLTLVAEALDHPEDQ